MPRYFSPRQALTLAEVIVAVHGGSKIRLPGYGPDELVEGTLRGFVTHPGTSTYSTCPDIRDAHIRITTKQGHDTWISVTEAMFLRDDGALAFS